MRSLGRDMRHGVRLLWKHPRFSVAALLALTLGMGAASAVFSVLNTVLLEPLPFRDPRQLLVMWEKNPAQNRYKLYVAPVNFMAWQAQSRTLEGMAGIQDVHINLTGGPNGHIDPEELKLERVSAGLFPLLGVQAAVGRVFRPEEDRPGRANFVLLSYSLWQRRFGADPAIGGKIIRLRDQLYTVTGVMPAGFAVIEPGVDVWIPLGLNPADARVATGRFLTVIGRMRRGQGVDDVRREMESIGAQTEQAVPALNRGWRPSIFVLSDELVGSVRQAIWVLAAAVGFLLLMACVNVANLLLARGAMRRKEMALRAALGAGRGRLLAQLLAESVILGFAGGVVGLLLAAGAVALVAKAGPAEMPRLADVSLNGRVFAVSLGIAMLTGLLFGAAPALQGSSRDLNIVLNEGGRGGTAGRAARLTRQGLVVVQVALAMVVLIGAGLLMRSFLRLRGVDPGFNAANVLTLRTPLGGARNTAPERRAAFMQQITADIAAIPGVRDAAAISSLPLTGLGLGAAFWDESRPAPQSAERPWALMRSVTPTYFKTMGIPLVAGRVFTGADQPQSPAVLIVNQTLARKLWPGGGAVGQRLSLDAYNSRSGEIVGVVGDVKPDRVQGEEWPTVYNPYAQTRVTTMVVMARTAGPPLGLRTAAERAIHAVDPDQVVADARTMDEIVGRSLAGARFNTTVLGIFAAVAFLLAAVGIYGVVAYDVGERTAEIGVRMAMGAQPADVFKLVVGQGARLAAMGIAIGVCAAFWLTRLMSTMLFGITPTDPVTFAGISVLLAAVALGASYLPSRRAMALDPTAALRHD